MSDDKMRADFEAWAKSEGLKLPKIKFGWKPDGTATEYIYPDTQIAMDGFFAGYQAGRKAEQAEVERLRAEVEMGHSFHSVAVKERDFERLLVEALKEELAAAKAASVVPVEIQSVYVNPYREVVVSCEESGTAQRFADWVRKMKDTTPAT